MMSFKRFQSFIVVSIILIGLVACEKHETVDDNDSYTLQIPAGFRMPPIPADNQLTNSRVHLGKLLFFDPILSADSTISCGSCHHPALAFADSLRVSKGVAQRTGSRNAPPLMNIAYAKSLFWDGGVPTLEQQVIAPIENHDEMALAMPDAIKKLKRSSKYKSLFQQAYGMEPSTFALVRAIACFERTLISGHTRYDQFMYGAKQILTDSEKRGFDLFFGEKGECFHCHNQFNLDDPSFQNNGLYKTYADSGRARITSQPGDVGKFKVPSLRNIAKTAPYMHDGSLATLKDVIEHYNSGGQGHVNQSLFIKPLHLTEDEKTDLINFLKSLTDDDFINNTDHRL